MLLVGLRAPAPEVCVLFSSPGDEDEGLDFMSDLSWHHRDCYSMHGHGFRMGPHPHTDW